MPWFHPCFINMHLDVSFTCGRRIVKCRDNTCYGSYGEYVEDITVFVFNDSLFFGRVDENTICNIFADHYDIPHENIHIYHISYFDDKIFVIFDYYSINDLMI